MVKSNEIINNIAKENNKSSEMLLDIFELNPDAISLTRVSDGEIIDCNQTYLNQIGYFRDEVIGHTSIELNLFSPEERRAYLNNIQRKKTLTDYEVKFKKKDDSFIYVLYSARFITVDDEEIILSIGHDITKRRQEERLKQELLEKEQQLTEELKVSNEELQSTTKELQVTNEELHQQEDKLLQTYNELKVNEERFRSIIENIQDAYMRADKEGTILLASPSAAHMYRFNSTQEMIGTTTHSYFKNSEDRNIAIEELKKHGKFNDYEVEARRNDGTFFWVSQTAQYYYDDQGKILGSETFVRDITERKRIEKKLRESDERFHDLADNIPNLAWMADATGWIFWYNTQWYDYTGTTLEEMQGWGWQKVHHPDYLESVTKEWASNIKAGKPYDNIFPLKGKDGNYRWFLTRVTPIRDEQGKLLRWFGTNTDITELKKAEERNQKILESEKELIEELTISNEELQSTSEELQTSNEELRCTAEELQISNENLSKVLKDYDQLNHTLVALRNSSFAMMHASDEDFYLDEVCRIIIEDCGHSMVWIGFTDEESKKVVPVTYSGFEEDYLRTLNITCDDTERGQGPTGTAIRTGKPSICGNMLIDPKFKPWREEAIKRGYASSIVIPIFLNDQVIGALTIYSTETNPFSEEEIKLLQELSDDISFGLTALRLRIAHSEAEEALQESLLDVQRSNAELEQFAYITSHDLREPLRMITSFLQLLERRYQDQLDKDANEFIGYAVDGAKRLDAMIQDILIYSKIANKERNLTYVNINNVLKQTYLNLKTSIDENDAHITNDHLPTLKVNEQLMVQLFQNLISNAIKYRRDESPKIHISAKKDDKYWEFSVKDNGIGISGKHLEKIFTIFQRLHTHEEYEGTGIGLAIVQKIVHQHNGEIWAESELGKGTTFYFTITQS